MLKPNFGVFRFYWARFKARIKEVDQYLAVPISCEQKHQDSFFFTTVKLDSRGIWHNIWTLCHLLFSSTVAWTFGAIRATAGFWGFPFSAISLAVSDLCLWGWSVSERYLDELGIHLGIDKSTKSMNIFACVKNVKQEDIHWNTVGFVHCTLTPFFKLCFSLHDPYLTPFSGNFRLEGFAGFHHTQKNNIGFTNSIQLAENET